LGPQDASSQIEFQVVCLHGAAECDRAAARAAGARNVNFTVKGQPSTGCAQQDASAAVGAAGFDVAGCQQGQIATGVELHRTTKALVRGVDGAGNLYSAPIDNQFERSGSNLVLPGDGHIPLARPQGHGAREASRRQRAVEAGELIEKPDVG